MYGDIFQVSLADHVPIQALNLSARCAVHGDPGTSTDQSNDSILAPGSDSDLLLLPR
jgi:hypothetical protein